MIFTSVHVHEGLSQRRLASDLWSPSQHQQIDLSAILNAIERTLKFLNGQSIKYFSYFEQSEFLRLSDGLKKRRKQ